MITLPLSEVLAQADNGLRGPGGRVETFRHVFDVLQLLNGAFLFSSPSWVPYCGPERGSLSTHSDLEQAETRVVPDNLRSTDGTPPHPHRRPKRSLVQPPNVRLPRESSWPGSWVLGELTERGLRLTSSRASLATLRNMTLRGPPKCFFYHSVTEDPSICLDSRRNGRPMPSPLLQTPVGRRTIPASPLEG